MTDKPKPSSARDIEVPGPFDNTPELPGEMTLAVKLTGLKRAIGPAVNKNDVGNTLIAGAIAGGARKATTIIDLLQGLGLDRRHIAVLLKKGTGANAATSRWRRDQAGYFWLHDEG